MTITDALEAGALRAYGTHRPARACWPRLAGHGPAALLRPEPVPGGAGEGELAAAYRNGTLNGPAFLASVNRVITLRESSK